MFSVAALGSMRQGANECAISRFSSTGVGIFYVAERRARSSDRTPTPSTYSQSRWWRSTCSSRFGSAETVEFLGRTYELPMCSDSTGVRSAESYPGPSTLGRDARVPTSRSADRAGMTLDGGVVAGAEVDSLLGACGV